MRFWFQKKTINVVIQSSKLRLHEYRSEPALVGAALRIFSNPDFKLMLQVVGNEHPAFTVFEPSTRAEVRAAHQAKSEGYTLALANLEALVVGEKIKPQIEPTFENEILES